MIPLLMTMIVPVCTEVYRAYVPDPPVIHLAVCSRAEILVTSNNTQLLQSSWTKESTNNKTMTFNVFCDGIPVCFVKNSMNDRCISVFTQIWKRNVSQTVSQSKEMSIPKYYEGSASDPHEIQP
jgi:hypothetical protein